VASVRPGDLERLSRSGAELWVSWQVLREYLAVVTRPQVWAAPLAPEIAVARVQTFEQIFRVAEDGPDVTSQLLRLVQEIGVAGKQIHDANITATMLARGVRRLLTFNTDDFARFSQLIIVETPT
jgi:predicted nucleic acid-binding protein